MTRRLRNMSLYILSLALVLCASGTAAASGGIYVNSASEVLGVDIGSAYAVGSGGVSPVSDTYVITGSGTQKLGDTASQPDTAVPGGEPDGTTVSVRATTARIGLYYYYSSSRDTSLSEARLENKIGSGYRFGYYDSSRVFHELASTELRELTMRPEGSGNGVNVYDTNSGALIYSHTDQSTSLGIMPISGSAKSVTWFKQVTYNGGFEYYRYNGGKLTVTNVVDIEDYIKGVVPIEMSASWPTEALKAQAVCARTYYARNVNAYSKYGFDVTADTYCQAYMGTLRATAASDAAVDAVSGEYLTYNGSLCDALYFSSDGGATENSENIFTSAMPYLVGKVDPFEEAVSASENGKKSWTFTLTGDQIKAKLNARGLSIGTVTSITPTFSAMGNVIKLTFADAEGGTAEVSKSACYSALGLHSVRYQISQSGGSFVFTGSGWGHNVGMSQFGAYSMAKNYGCNYRQILRFYYTGASISTGV